MKKNKKNANRISPKTSEQIAGTMTVITSVQELKELAQDPHRLARAFLSGRYTDDGRCTLRYWKNDFWRWTGRNYRRIEDAEFQAELTGAIIEQLRRDGAMDAGGHAVRVKKSLTADTMAIVQALTLIPSDCAQPSRLGSFKGQSALIALNNGLLELDSVLNGYGTVLHRHTPDWFSSVALPYDYQPKAECPKFIEFMNWMFENDPERIALIQEWMGYCLTPDTSQQKFMLLTGSGANGKSVLLKVLTAVLGKENVSALGPDAFRRQFMLIGLLGKLANVCADAEFKGDLDEGKLKALTGEDAITVDRKFKDQLTFTSTAKIVFATNTPPVFEDESDGIWRRLIHMPCRAVIGEKDRNTKLADTLSSELPGILNWAIEGLRRLRLQKGFTHSEVVTAATEALRRLDPLQKFLREHCERDAAASVLTTELWTECQAHGLSITPEGLGKAVARLFAIHRDKRSSTMDPARPWEYRGIRLRTEPVAIESAVQIEPVGSKVAA